MNKKIVGIFICMLLISTIFPVTANILDNKTYDSTMLGDTLYVGGTGPGNYSTIKSAIDNAVDGDTVFVYNDSSPYHELLLIDKSIDLIGEDRYSTVIDGKLHSNTIEICITADFVTIQGFTIKGHNDSNSGIIIYSNYNIIKNNVINYGGVTLGGLYNGSLFYSNNNFIEGNIFTENFIAIVLDFANNNIISGNTISKSNSNAHGICLRMGPCCNNSIISNSISFNDIGIWLDGEKNYNLIKNNKIFSNDIGVSIVNSNYNKVIENNIYDNKINAHIIGYFKYLIKENCLFNNIFDSNYWGRARYFPKPIKAICVIFTLFPICLITFDRNPAKEPYDIVV